MPTLDELLKQRQQERSAAIVEDPTRSLDERLAERQRLRKQGQILPDPLLTDRARREEFLATQTPTGELLGTPGMEDLSTRFDLGFSDIFLEKKAKFLDKFPEGDFIEVFEPRTTTEQRGTTVLFRRNPNEPYMELDARAIDKAEYLADLTDLSGEIPATVVEVGVMRGGRLVNQLLRVAAGTFAGDVLKEAVEETRGYQMETLPDLMSRLSQRAAFSTAGAGVTIVVSGPINAVRGAPSIKIAKSAPTAQRAAKRLGVPNLLPSQIARSPLVRKMGGQAGAVMTRIGDYVNFQQEALVRAISRLRAKDLTRVFRGELKEVHDEARAQIVKAAQLTPQRNLTEGGTAIQQGIAEYNELAEMITNRAYTKARLVETPQFDISSLKAVARELKEGIRGIDEAGEAVALSAQNAELREIAEKIISLDSTLPATFRPDGTAIEAVDQLRALRSRLWDMKTPPPGQIARQPEKEAGRLYGAITRILRNPTNDNPEFVRLWREADAVAAGRFDTMEKLIVVQSAKTEAPAQMAARLSQPNQVDNLRILRDSMPDSRWQEFQEAIRADFIDPNKIDNLTTRLDGFDKSTLDTLFTGKQQAALREIGAQIDELNSVGIQQALQKQTQRGALLNEWIESGETARIQGLLVLALNDATLRKSLRAELMERVYRNSVVTEEGVQAVNRAALQGELNTLRESGAIRFLELRDIRVLKEAETIAEFLPARADSGTSLQAGEAVAGIRSGTVEAIQTIVEHMGVGRLMTSEIFQRALLGAGKKPLPFNNLRVLGSVLGRAVADLEEEPQNGS